MQGIDGNPPLYMLVAWLSAQLPYPAATEAKLFVLNVAIAGATLIVLFRLARLFVAFEAALAALALLLVTNAAFIEPVLHPRAYPLFLLCAATAALMALRWQERGERRDGVLFALACVALAPEPHSRAPLCADDRRERRPRQRRACRSAAGTARVRCRCCPPCWRWRSGSRR